ncbi:MULTISPECIES: hypothetical protein [unclassified Mesorhizobium]|uniref:hypothetical protein n=1 Tax=unclassified Mesorhizobium TaxID=325217 RepID=UPI000FCBF3A6|nr:MULTISPECIES: hypothetical protein [unclassified Mesorhizobium]TGP27247.1 hypothetical protein EN874_006385 [Mesorhizobium sp. M1D.F.Ca.ET.231.01.1.1]TGP39205.1 hypothetical protein EN877_06385 [Mesorhizobium sp. M1D.F.Ca.ET.234.01.1.1]TGS51414.1 hypothetical protein EN827_06385 [Mesorhizobium sp. M1D.F.Ca.ET.184.01.1.1]TGS67298.1 hypothetical protein EN826_006385 [Mesorhizobium sp. M1D.F.Ca.ET.183.01.1.1]
MSNGRLAFFYVARGRDVDSLSKFRRFVAAYKKHHPGADHDLFIIFKGFDDDADLGDAKAIFSNIRHEAISTDDDNFDLGAYRVAAEGLTHEYVGLLNSNSEPNSDAWMAKLFNNLGPNIGAVGATGSFESLNGLDSRIPPFPNVHLRSTALIMRRLDLLHLFPNRIPDKLSAFHVESGPNSFTRQFFERGMSVLVVGGDGRGYPVPRWPDSKTFRQGLQENLLVHDNVTRMYNAMSFERKKEISGSTWGDYIKPGFGIFPDDWI